MADKKISALTAASTPLAGTEVLPIVQSGATVKVAVSDLTAGRSVSTASLTTNGKLTTSFAAGGSFVAEFQNTTSATPYGVWVRDAATPVAGYPLVYVSDSTGASTYFRVDSSNGNTTVGIGNLVMGTAAKGIDFSINTAAPGVTSELLDDYETGTWTPTYTPASGAFGAITYNSNTFGRYTKVGNAVFIVGLIITDAFAVGTGTGQGRISGLPFTPSPSASASINYSTNFNLDTPTGSITSGTDIFLTSRVTSNGSSAAFNSANFTTGASAFANYAYFQLNYVV